MWWAALLNTILGAFSSGVPPIPPSSYESIATVNGTGSSGTITFSSIPATYASLQLRYISRNTAAGTGSDNVLFRFNSDTGSNYAFHSLNGNGSVASASGSATQTSIRFNNGSTNNGETAGIMTVGIVDIFDYASTTKNKTVKAFQGNDNNGNSTALLRLVSGLWMNTNAISTITLTLNLANNFTTASTFALYGVKG
jgi:hypothetical protein